MAKEYTRFDCYHGDRNYQDDELVKLALTKTDFDKKSAQGKGFCQLLGQQYIFQDEKTFDYSIVIYPLDEPGLLDSAAKREYILAENDELILHRIAVVRNGVYLDKQADVQIHVLDYDEQGNRGVLSHRKKISLIIKDLRLQDILIFENTTVSNYPKTGLKHDFKQAGRNLPDPFWFYGKYFLRVINQTSQDMIYKECYFRDNPQHQVVEPKVMPLPIGKDYLFEADNVSTDYDPKTEVRPFIDFATQTDYGEVADATRQLYQKVLEQNGTWLEVGVPELVKELAQYATLDEKIRFAIEFVQNSIYYVYDEEIMDGHEPQAPQITYETRQGDCKAKTVLLKSLLDYLKVEATCVLVNYDLDYYIPFYCSSPFNFNHVILKIAYQGETYFVDATLRNQFGFLPYRAVPEFMYYLPIEPQADLQCRPPFWHKNYLIEEEFSCTVTDGVGEIKKTLLLRGQNADGVRQMFKNESDSYLFNIYTTPLYYNMCLTDNFTEKELPQYFTNHQLEIISDNLDLNELQIKHQTTLSKPYTSRKDNRRYLNYWDRSYLDDKAQDFDSKDLPFWLSHASEKVKISLRTDEKIDAKEKFTTQVCQIESDYLRYQTTKQVDKHGAKMTIDYQTMTNAPIKDKALDNYLAADKQVRDNNFGLTIDLLNKGVFDKFKHLFD